MNHLSSEQLLDAYYGEFDASEHLESCSECRLRFEDLEESLNSIRNYPGPEREPAAHAADVWARLEPKLQPKKPKSFWFRGWTLAPAFAAMLGIAFVAGTLTERFRSHPDAISPRARERVLLISVSDHLEQSQIVLTNVANASPGSPDLLEERDRAHELLGANRLLRQTALHLGDLTDAALLDEVERALLDVANTPLLSSTTDLERIQQRIAREGLLFRVRVGSVATRERGQKI